MSHFICNTLRVFIFVSIVIGLLGGYTFGRWEKRHTQMVKMLVKDIKEEIVKEKTTITSPSKVYKQKTALNGLETGMFGEDETSKYA